jgi:hypothetical protein
MTELAPGVYFDVPEELYHSDPCEQLSLSASVAQALVLESEAHAYLRHPRLGGQPFKPKADMDRGTLIHALLLGKGREVAVVECDEWRKKADKEARDAHRAEGRLPVTRALHDSATVAANELRRKLAARGYHFRGKSEVTLVWQETAKNGGVVLCRGRVDHLEDGFDILDLKITGDANPRTLTRGHLTRMGYDIQGAAYPRGLESVTPRVQGRARFTLLFCEPEPPYCITAVRFGGSLRELGERKWLRGVNRWERCVRTGEWRDYTDAVVFAEAKPWELDEEDELLESA